MKQREINEKVLKIDGIETQLAEIAKFFSAYEPVGDGVADDSLKLKQALNELEDGGILHLGNSDKIYRLNSPIIVTGKTVHLKANGATLMQGFNGEMFIYTGLYGTPYNVTEVTTESVTFGDSGGTMVTKLKVPSHTFKKGDVIKIVSDDILIGSRQSTARSGEYQVVQLVIGEDVYLSSKLRDIDTYATNVRAVKHEDKTITIEGVNLTSAPESEVGKWNFGWLVINGAYKPILKNIELYDGHAPAINLIGCYAYRLDNIKGSNLTNNPSLGRYGYGINDKGSEYGESSNLHFENVRHGFTTNANTVSENSLSFWRYGRPAYFTVSNSTGIGTSNATFDTHEESYAGQFTNCTARGVVKGNSSSGSGFTARGKKLRYDNCRVYDSAVGWQVLSAYEGDTEDIVINNCDSYGSTSATLSVQQGLNGTKIKGIKIHGGKHHTLNKFVYAIGGVVEIRNVDVEAPFESAGLDGILRVNSADIYFDELRIDMSGSTSSNIQVCKIQNTSFPLNGWSIKGRRLEVILSSGVTHFARGDANDATNNIIITDLVLSRNLTMTSGLTGATLINYSIDGDLSTVINGRLNIVGSNPSINFNNNAQFNFDGVNFNISLIANEVLKKLLELKSTELVLNDSEGNSYFHTVNNPANNYAGLKIKYRADSSTKYNQVVVGNIDSGGTGYRILRLPN